MTGTVGPGGASSPEPPSRPMPADAVPAGALPRPPLVRPRAGRMIAGVALGLAAHLGVPVRMVRIVLVGTAFVGGFGPLLYLWLWAFVPVAQTPLASGGVPGVPRPGVPRPGAPPAGFPGRSSPPPPSSPPGGVPGPGLYGGTGGHWPGMARRGRLATVISRGREHAGLGTGMPGAPAGVAVGPAGMPGAPAGMPGAPAGMPGAPAGVAVGPAGVAVGPAGVAVGPAGGGAPTLLPGGTGQAGRGSRDGGSRASDLLIGAALLVAGLAMLGGRLGYDVQLGVVVPLVVVVGGALLAYTQLDEVERHRWAARTGVGGTRAAVLRVGGGLALVLTGTLIFLLQSVDVVTAGRALIAVLAVLAGTALVLAPWGVRLWRDLDTERAARIREAERADLAAHLHDSVLQTLALIQRQSGDQTAVTRLARSQERDLRDWLYGPRPVDGGTLATEVRAAAADVEDRHGVAVEVVLVGDRPYDERVGALVAALREAIVNAVRHAGAPVQVYVESGPGEVEAFVRDRGPGFELATVPTDRLGVRESIIARMERHAGRATVRSHPGEGTEIRLVLPHLVADSSGQQEGRRP